MKTQLFLAVVALVSVLASACGSSSAPGQPSDSPSPSRRVNTVLDLAAPPAGVVTLRSALAAAEPGEPIRFEADLDGARIPLSLVAADHTPLTGEVMGMREGPTGPVSYLVGYFERDYGRSALYAQKDVVIDASDLPSGITIEWAGEEGDDARVLAVLGDLEMRNVTITRGRSTAVELPGDDPDDQPWTLGRGGGVAVWGRAHLVGCTLYDNHCVGDFESSRDRGAFGGGLYANVVELEDCVVVGNTVLGAGAAGGGVFSVGGADEAPQGGSALKRCTVSGNRISALFTYGGGVYSDGGGIGERKALELENCTIARNVVEPPPGVPSFLLAIGYWRGGGVYMSNGHLRMRSCTVVENDVFGVARTDELDKPNLAGGIAATIGNAHAVEQMVVGHSIVTGNRVHELGPDGLPARTYDHDVFTGSLFEFRSQGHNRFGVLDFNQILVPVGVKDWRSLCRRHYPKEGDACDVAVDDVLDLDGGVTFSGWMDSAGSAPGTRAVLSYAPSGTALDRIPPGSHRVTETVAEYDVSPGATDDFLPIALSRIEAHYGRVGFADAFRTAFEAYLATVDVDADTPGLQPYPDPGGDPVLTLAAVHWHGPAETWPQELVNHPWIEFWHHLDRALAAEDIVGMGPELLGDDAWAGLFSSGPLVENPDIDMLVGTTRGTEVELLAADQFGRPRPANADADIGAVETP